MAHDEEVEDLGDLESTLPASSGAEEGIEGQLVPPSDSGEGPVMTPAPICAGEDPMMTPAPTCAGEDPVPAAALTGEDTLVVAVEQTAEDPAASADPS
jgi:hypothetical protein